MIDFLLGLYFASLVVRGWVRGFVKEALDLAGLLLGLAIAFRLSGPAGRWLSAFTGVSETTGRVVGGLALFIIIGLGMALASHYLHKVASLPGLKLSNRLLGAGIALSWGLALATLVLSLLTVLPMGISDSLDDSRVSAVLTDPESPTHKVFTALAGDRVLDTALSLQKLLGDRNVIVEPDERVELEPQDPDRLKIADTSARDVFDLLNISRIEVGLDPLAWSEGLAQVGREHAWEMYVDGYFSHTSPKTDTIADRVAVAGITYRLVGENLALAATPAQVHDGLMQSPGHRANIIHQEFRRVGIGVVEGPLGLMVVQVFSG